MGPAGLSLSPSMSFQAFATLWTSGELAKRYPDHVKKKRSVDNDVSRLERHVYPLAGKVALGAFSLDDAERVMRALPRGLATNTRRHVAQLMVRVLSLAVFPARLITASPLPRGFLPKLATGKALTYLYPDEDARLLACTAVPLPFRVFYGFLAREGMRASEAAGLTFADVDLDRGAVRLDTN